MLTVLFVSALVASATAGYASSSSGAGAGLYSNTNSYDQTYGSKYPYSNSYTGYAQAGAPYVPVAPFASPYDYQNAFQQYFNSLSAYNAKYG